MGLIRNIRKGLTFLHRDLAVEPEDAAFVHEYLTAAEYDLFWRLSVPDQVHSIRVARLCQRALPSFPELCAPTLLRAALLHDIGKTQADLNITFRTVWTLVAHAFPDALDRLGGRFAHARPGTLRHRMYVQARHGDIGAALLEQLGTEQLVCDLVRNTALPADCPRELADRIISAADADRVLQPGE